MTKSEIKAMFALFSGTTGGIDGWLTNADDTVFGRLATIEKDSLSMVQLNQLLVLSHEAGVSEGFFAYYWLAAPRTHPYVVRSLPDYDETWTKKGTERIISLKHLRWGLYRLFVDALLFFGNIRSAYRTLRDMTEEQLQKFFQQRRFDTDAIRRRGPALPLADIAKDERYLISEMACKSYNPRTAEDGDLKAALHAALAEHKRVPGGSPRIKIKDLLEGTFAKAKFSDRQTQFIFSADDLLDEDVGDAQELDAKFARVAAAFERARQAALTNTSRYLSMVNDLDVYTATSMRSRKDFRSMAETCEVIFSDSRLRDLHLRYFDPTMSAAEGHEDKGLIECLMVKCAKVLVYSAGEKESYGKDAEAAMALSLGKPVIFYCEQRDSFYRDVHPLSRLIHFDTGVAVGAFIAEKREQVTELLYRILTNTMEYELEQPRPGHYRLKEKLTGSVVRLQTGDELLRETFWNYYHNRAQSPIA